MVKANVDTEAGVMPSEELFTAMGRYNEQLVDAGIVVAGDGLQPSSRGARVHFSFNKRTTYHSPLLTHPDMCDARSMAAPAHGRGASPAHRLYS
jgi:hypothetical protein